MTLDDLIEAFNAAGFQMREDARNWDNLMPDKEACDRAGIAAVVLALRDEIVEKTTHYAWTGNEIHNAFDEILGSDAEAAAGGQGDNPVVSGTSQMQTPAADQKVCVWTPHHRTEVGLKWEAQCGAVSFRDFVNCPSCGLPIKFKEAAQ